MLKFDPVSRDRMFYDRYEYGVCVTVPEAGCLRAKSHKELDQLIAYRNRARAQWAGVKEQISKNIRNDLFAVFDELQKVRDQIKLVVSYNIMYIYSNNISSLKHLANLEQVHFCNAVQSVVDKPRDVVLITNPKFKYRSYFKDRVLEKTECERLLNFIESRKDVFRVTRTLKANLNRFNVHYLQRHLFVEHNDPADITMLSLVVPGLIRKTLSVQAK
jgi:hypothetical protein